jgi:hypothetical protein
MILAMNFFFINETIGKNTRFENAYLSGFCIKSYNWRLIIDSSTLLR